MVPLVNRAAGIPDTWPFVPLTATGERVRSALSRDRYPQTIGARPEVGRLLRQPRARLRALGAHGVLLAPNEIGSVCGQRRLACYSGNRTLLAGRGSVVEHLGGSRHHARVRPSHRRLALQCAVVCARLRHEALGLGHQRVCARALGTAGSRAPEDSEVPAQSGRRFCGGVPCSQRTQGRPPGDAVADRVRRAVPGQQRARRAGSGRDLAVASPRRRRGPALHADVTRAHGHSRAPSRHARCRGRRPERACADVFAGERRQLPRSTSLERRRSAAAD